MDASQVKTGMWVRLTHDTTKYCAPAASQATYPAGTVFFIRQLLRGMTSDGSVIISGPTENGGYVNQVLNTDVEPV